MDISLGEKTISKQTLLEYTGVGLVAQEGDNSDKKWELKLKQALDRQLQVPRRKQFTVKPHTPGFSQNKHRKKIAGSHTRKGTMVSSLPTQPPRAGRCLYVFTLSDSSGVLQINHTDLQITTPDHCSAPAEHSNPDSPHQSLHAVGQKAKQRKVLSLPKRHSRQASWLLRHL